MTDRYRLRLGIVLCLALLAGLVTAAAASADLGDRKLSLDMKGTDVAKLQSVLTDLGIETAVDGRFGEPTETNLRRYEEREALPVNGVLGKCQAADMLLESREGELPAGADSGSLGDRKLTCGTSGADVERLQRLLTKLDVETPVTGYFGKATESSVLADELAQGLQQNGTVSDEHARSIKRRVKGEGDGSGRRHVFPVQGPHNYGGSGSRYGAPRAGHSHGGQDVAAALGTPLVAVHDGVVSANRYQAGGAGFYLVIRGDEGLDSVYMHMREAGIVRDGQRVTAGQRIGYVGSTGGSTGPHLHFELWTPNWFAGGHRFDPLRKLLHWDESS